jgi:hypothetical protein
MKQIEIDCVKEFAEKMREFGYVIDVKIDKKPLHEYRPREFRTRINLECSKLGESKDALFWDDLSLYFQTDILQKPGNTAFPEKAIEQEGRENPWKKD